MHEHDRDLVMALAEGALDPASAAKAEAKLTSCEECAAELELQRLALGALATVPEAGLSELEAARLHRHLRQELGLVPAAEPAPRRRLLPLGAIGLAAAVLIAVVAIGPALNLLGSGESDDESIFAADAIEEEAAPEAAATAELSPEPDVAAAPRGLDETALAGASAATEAPAEAGLESLDAGALPAEGAAVDLTQSDLQEYAQQITTDETERLWFTAIPESATSTVAGDQAMCGPVGLDTVEGAVQYSEVGAGLFEGSESVIVAYRGPELDGIVVIAHDATTCAELGRSEE